MLSAEGLLHVWEQAQRGSVAQRSLVLLSHALPERDRASLAGLDLAQRDWHLLRLRRRWFGAALAGCAECPACSAQMEVDVDAAAIEGECPGEAPPFVAENGRRFRLPTIGDLIAVGGTADADAAARRLLARCCLDESTTSDLPATYDEIDSGLASIAEDRAIAIVLACPDCGETSHHRLDPADFLWAELSSAAAELIEDVHLLARAYGWPERDILAMSSARRRAYLNRVDA